MLINKEDIIVRLCDLMSLVNDKKFGWTVPTDCFCGGKEVCDGFSFEEEVLLWVEKCVRDKLKEVTL